MRDRTRISPLSMRMLDQRLRWEELERRRRELTARKLKVALLMPVMERSV